ncbi:hypothetical protein T4B_2279, partial [Trichinella pseudospiralis]
LALCTCMHFEFSPFIDCLLPIIIMKVNCTIFEFFFFNYWWCGSQNFYFGLYLLVMGIQQRTSLDFESRSSIKKIQRLCLTFEFQFTLSLSNSRCGYIFFTNFCFNILAPIAFFFFPNI